MTDEPDGGPAFGYREHRPHPALAGHVECYWSYRGGGGSEEGAPVRVLPDGCMDVMFSLAGAALRPQGAPPAACTVGTMTRALLVEHPGDLQLLGVRFHPGAAPAFLGLPARELVDDVAPLSDSWGYAAGEARDRLGAEPGLAGRLRVLDDLLLGRLASARAATDQHVLRAMAVASAGRGLLGVDALAGAAGLGRRQLERRFLDAVGMPPKVACRIVRFRAAVARLHADPEATLSAVAHRSGYADQPHFTREFRELAGVTPGAYRQPMLVGAD